MPELDFKKILADGILSNEKILKKYRASILRSYKTSLDETRALLAELYARYGDSVDYATALKYNRLPNIENEIKAVLNKAGVKFKAANKNAIAETFKNSYYRSGFAFEKTTSIDLGFTRLSEKKIEAAILNPVDRITWIDRATAHGQIMNRQIREKIAQGLIQGKGYSATARDLKGVIEKKTGDLIRVVQTETHRAQTMGELAGFDQVNNAASDLGFETLKVWNATLDGKTRPTHQELDGKEADEDGLFHAGGLTTEGPGLFGVAEEDINCRCYVSFEMKGLSPTIRRDNESGEIIAYKTYNEWAAGKKII